MLACREAVMDVMFQPIISLDLSHPGTTVLNVQAECKAGNLRWMNNKCYTVCVTMTTWKVLVKLTLIKCMQLRILLTKPDVFLLVMKYFLIRKKVLDLTSTATIVKIPKVKIKTVLV